MSKFYRGDVLLIQFPYTDLSSSKLRPAVVLSNNSSSNDIIVAFISSVIPNDNTDETMIVLDNKSIGFAETGLKCASVFRLSKLATLEKSLAQRKIGFVIPALMKQIEKCLVIALGLPLV